MNKKKTIVQKHEANFETLKQAFANSDVCLMDCIERSTGEHVAVICAVHKEGDMYAFTPVARFFNDNPYEMLVNPDDPEYAELDKPKLKAPVRDAKVPEIKGPDKYKIAKEVWAEYIDQMPGNKYDGEFIPWCAKRFVWGTR